MDAQQQRLTQTPVETGLLRLSLRKKSDSGKPSEGHCFTACGEVARVVTGLCPVLHSVERPGENPCRRRGTHQSLRKTWVLVLF